MWVITVIYIAMVPCFIADASYNPHHLALIVYYFPSGILPLAQKHGNAKEDIPFFPTLASTRDLVKMECQDSGPKQVLHNVSSRIGGLLSSSCPGELPRNERQIKYEKKVKVPGCNPADELYSIMFKARQELITFVRDIKVLPEPAIILALDYQLDDLVRFATNDDHCVLTIDPTFSLGKFDVTPITYRHLLFKKEW